MDFKKTVAVITGACGGIGSRLTQDLLEKGAKVLMADLTGEEVTKELQKKYGTVNVVFKRCDVTKEDEFEAAFDECEKILGKANLLVNNAGICDEVNFSKTLEVNLHAPIIGTRIALNRMGINKGHSGGTVVNVASTLGIMTEEAICCIYAASKAGLIHYTRKIGSDFHLNETGVRVKAVCPHLVKTKFALNSKYFYDRCGKRVEKYTSSKTYPALQPEDVSSAILKLLSDCPSASVMVVGPNEEPYLIPPTEIYLPIV